MQVKVPIDRMQREQREQSAGVPRSALRLLPSAIASPNCCTEDSGQRTPTSASSCYHYYYPSSLPPLTVIFSYILRGVYLLLATSLLLSSSLIAITFIFACLIFSATLQSLTDLMPSNLLLLPSF